MKLSKIRLLQDKTVMTHQQVGELLCLANHISEKQYDETLKWISRSRSKEDAVKELDRLSDIIDLEDDSDMELAGGFHLSHLG